jgi:hypothetical protein
MICDKYRGKNTSPQCVKKTAVHLQSFAETLRDASVKNKTIGVNKSTHFVPQSITPN